MTLLSPAAQSASLDNDYGANKGPNAAAAHELALFNGDPRLGGTELTSDGGYARVVITNNGTNWPGASGGSTTSAQQTFAASTDAWSDTATFFVLYDHADGTTAWDSGELADEISVETSGTEVATSVTVYYEDSGV